MFSSSILSLYIIKSCLFYDYKTFPYPPPSNDLPAGYTQTEYLEGSNGSVLITPAKQLLPTDTLFLDFQFRNYLNAAPLVYGTPSQDVIQKLYNDTSGNITGYGYHINYYSGTQVFDGYFSTSRRTLYVGQSVFLLDSILRPTSSTSSTSFYVMGQPYSNGSPLSSNMRVYRLTIWDVYGETTKVDLIPCTRDSDGARGLYDVVADTFNLYIARNIFVSEYNPSTGMWKYYFTYPVKSDVTVSWTVYPSLEGLPPYTRSEVVPKGSTTFSATVYDSPYNLKFSPIQDSFYYYATRN